MSDVMLTGVLRMPFDDHGDPHLIQLRQRCNEAANQLEIRADRIRGLESELSILRKTLTDAPEVGIMGPVESNADYVYFNGRYMNYDKSLRFKLVEVEGVENNER